MILRAVGKTLVAGLQVTAELVFKHFVYVPEALFTEGKGSKMQDNSCVKE